MPNLVIIVILIQGISHFQVATCVSVGTSPGRKRRSYSYRNPKDSGIPNCLKFVTPQGRACLRKMNQFCEQRSVWLPLSDCEAGEILQILGLARTAQRVNEIRRRFKIRWQGYLRGLRRSRSLTLT